MVSRSDRGIQVKNLDSWDKGLISSFPASRMPETALGKMDNAVIKYDGVVSPRGGFFASGVPDIDEGYEPMGCDTVFKRDDGSEGLINMFTDGEFGYIFTLERDELSWKKHDLKYTTTDVPCFDQVAGSVIIATNKDKFSYFDIEKNEIVQFEFIEDPTDAPTVTGSGFSGTNTMDFFYRIAYNGVGGTTMMSPAKKISVPSVRENWSASQYATIKRTGTPPSGVKSWNIYLASVPTGSGNPTDEEYLQLKDGIPVDTDSFTDNGSTVVLQLAPVENSTEGVRLRYVKNISGRVWGIGTNSNIVYWGGDIGHELYFGTAYGSDSYAVNKGGIETPMSISLGRDNSGTTCINLLTRTTAGQGAIWDVYATTNSVQMADNNIQVGTYQFKKREGNDGTDAPHSVIHENDNIYYLSMEGFKSTGVKPNITGIQATDIVSAAIKDRVLSLNRNELAKCFVAYYDECLFWAVNYGSKRNNEIWVYDILHGGVWSIFKIESDAILRWSRSDSESPSLYIRQGTKLLRYNPSSKTHTDSDVPFVSTVSSGLIPFKDDFLTWVHLLKVVWQLNNAKGKVTLTINMHAKNGDIINNKSLVISDTSKTRVLGWGAINGKPHFNGGWSRIEGWGDIIAIEDASAETNAKISQKIRKNVNYISFSISCDTAGSFYTLSRVGLLFTYIGEGIEFLSQKGLYKI